jgi:Flp pilus assembly protein TadD
MTRIGRHIYLSLERVPALPIATIAALTASLLLGACSQSPSLLQDLALKSDNTGSTDSDSPRPQTELQKSTLYWGQEYAKRPTELEPALNYAKDLKALGEKRKAFAVLQQAAMFHSNDPKLVSEYGRLALELNQVNVAGQLLAAADDPARPDWRVISARGTVLAKQGKYSDAVPFYERALTLSPNNPTIMNNLAMAHAMMGDPKKAEEILRRAAAVTGASPKIRENLALVLGLQGRYDESRSVASSVLDSDTASANTKYLKQLVKLDARSEMPDAKSFMTQTTVARAPAPQQDQRNEAVASEASAPSAQGDWQTVSANTASLPTPLKGTETR